MNKCFLIGRLTADPEVRYTQDGKAVGNFTLAVDRRSADKGADFIHMAVWEKRAEFTEKYLRKGTKIAVVGHIQTGSYTNREGRKIYTTDVVVDEIEFAESKTAASEETKTSEPSSDWATAVPGVDDLPFN